MAHLIKTLFAVGQQYPLTWGDFTKVQGNPPHYSLVVPEEGVAWHNFDQNYFIYGHEASLKPVQMLDVGFRVAVQDADGVQHVFKVTETRVIREDGPWEERVSNAEWATAKSDQPIVTIMTCYQGTDRRFLIRAVEVKQ